MNRATLSCALVLVCLLAIASRASAQEKPDSTYGSGGSKAESTVTHDDGTVEKTTTWRDKDGTVREQFTEVKTKDGDVTETHDWFNQFGMKIAEDVGKYDKSDHCTYWREEDYLDDGVLDAGDIWEDDANGRRVHKKYNRETEKYDAVGYIRFDFLRVVPGFKKPVLLERTFFIGAAIVFEDSGQRFATYGVEGSYTHPLNREIGIMADAQWTRGMQDEVTWTKLQFLAGLVFCEQAHDRLSLAPHILAGLARVTPDYGEPAGTGTATNAFALAAGVDLGVRLNRRSDLLIRADYNPTFSGGTQNNVRLTAGARFLF